MKTTCLALPLALMLAAPASAATVINGSFETTPTPLPTAGGWALYDALDGWTASGARIEVQSNPTLGLIDAQDGNNYVELHSDGLSTISQSVSLDAGYYEMTFFYSARGIGSGNNDMSFALGDLFSGSVLGAPSEDFPRGEWTEVGTKFTVATAGDYLLSFSALPGQNDRVGALIDNISISVAAVPVPAAGLMLLTALGGAAALRRKKA